MRRFPNPVSISTTSHPPAVGQHGPHRRRTTPGTGQRRGPAITRDRSTARTPSRAPPAGRAGAVDVDPGSTTGRRRDARARPRVGDAHPAELRSASPPQHRRQPRRRPRSVERGKRAAPRPPRRDQEEHQVPEAPRPDAGSGWCVAAPPIARRQPVSQRVGPAPSASQVHGHPRTSQDGRSRPSRAPGWTRRSLRAVMHRPGSSPGGDRTRRRRRTV